MKNKEVAREVHLGVSRYFYHILNASLIFYCTDPWSLFVLYDDRKLSLTVTLAMRLSVLDRK